jgi:hypothetical protein
MGHRPSRLRVVEQVCSAFPKALVPLLYSGKREYTLPIHTLQFREDIFRFEPFEVRKRMTALCSIGRLDVLTSAERFDIELDAHVNESQTSAARGKKEEACDDLSLLISHMCVQYGPRSTAGDELFDPPIYPIAN